ncbi:MAG: heme A synthase [Chloroflexi bacterium]|nr:heme A synthase [Chloroflexota bacterium]
MTALGTSVRPAGRITAGRGPRYSALALSAYINVLLLITVGSIVRVTGNGLGCPDWPGCYGQVLPPANPSAWVEFSHRFLAAAATVQIVGLAVLAWRDHRREAWVSRPAVAAVGLLVVQIALGGLHVIYQLPPATGWIHTGVAMGVAGLVAAQVAVMHPAAQRLTAGAGAAARDKWLSAAIPLTASAMYLLILTGSYVTRSGSSLACPSFPSCGVEASSDSLRRLIDIQMLHRFAAFGVALAACLTLWRLARVGGGEGGWRGVTAALTALIVVQFGLGISNVLLRVPMWSRTLHLFVAAALWTGLTMLWVIVRRARAVG